MTREQYDARCAEMLRAYARIVDPHASVGHVTTAEYLASREITAFVRQFWQDAWYPTGHQGMTHGC